MHKYNPHQKDSCMTSCIHSCHHLSYHQVDLQTFDRHKHQLQITVLYGVLQEPRVTAKLESETGKEVYASADIGTISNSWSHSNVMLTSNATDAKAQLTLYIEGEADLAVRLISLFPADNVKGAVLQPFRPDLLQYLKDLQPRFDTPKHFWLTSNAVLAVLQ